MMCVRAGFKPFAVLILAPLLALLIQLFVCPIVGPRQSRSFQISPPAKVEAHK